MTELILSDITRMAGGHCVIGLEAFGQRFRSVRPLPPAGHAWPSDFAHHRGERLQFNLTPVVLTRPHVEDRQSSGVAGQNGQVSEADLMNCLKQAELAARVKDLFGCSVRPGKTGASVHAPKASRSICGVEPAKVRLKCEADQIRAYVAFPSGEVLADLPVVDRSWHRFVQAALRLMAGANRAQRLNRYLSDRLLDAGIVFVRLGLTRPHPPRWGRSQVMVDTLFPLPRKSWIDEFEAKGP
jgi:hypothetical protein